MVIYCLCVCVFNIVGLRALTFHYYLFNLFILDEKCYLLFTATGTENTICTWENDIEIHSFLDCDKKHC